MTGGIVELDLHGMNTYQAQIAIDAALTPRRQRHVPPAPSSTATAAARPSVLLLDHLHPPRPGQAPGHHHDGVTDLVLRGFGHGLPQIQIRVTSADKTENLRRAAAPHPAGRPGGHWPSCRRCSAAPP